MENPRKTRTRTLPVSVNIGAGAGRFGIGGIVLLGGALVAATIASAVAFKTRSQRRPSSDNNLKKSVSPSLSPETQSVVDDSNRLEPEDTKKSNIDFSNDSSPLELQNLSDEVTSMEIQTTSIQSLTLDERHNYGIENGQLNPRDSSEDITVSLVGEDQENTSIHVDSVFEREVLVNNCETIDLNCEEQVAVAAQIDKDACLERDEDGNEEHVDANSLVSEVVKLIEEYEVIEGPVQDIVAEASEIEEGEIHQEIVFMNGSSETEATMEIVDDQTAAKEASKNEDEDRQEADIVADVSENEEEDEVHQETVLMNESSEIAVGMEVVDDETTAKEDTPPSQSMNQEYRDKESAQNLEEQVITEVKLNDKNQTDNIDEIPQDGLTEAAIVDDQKDNLPRKLMNNEDKEDKDEIDVSEASENEDEDCQETVFMNEASEEDVTKEDEKNNLGAVPQDQLTEAAIIDDQKDNPPRKLMNNKDENQETGMQVKTEMITESELFKKDEIPHDQSVEEDEYNEEDVIVKSELCADEVEAKISGHKIEENMEETQTILSKNKSDIEEKQAFASELWNLKVMTWAVLISVWCLCHWYSELPFLELSLVVSLLFILILLGPSNRTWSNMVKHA